jgi:hypothetical protein
MEFSMRAECALSGACTSFNGNTLSFRLHTYDGYAGLVSVPASTVNPGRAACPPIPPIKPDLANQVSPAEFPYKVVIGAGALGGLILGGILMALWKRRK